MAVSRRGGAGRPTDETVLRYGAAIMVAFLVVGTVLVVASLLVGGGDYRPAAAAAPSRSATPTSSAAESPSPTAEATPRMTGTEMTAFLRDYLATAPRDQGAAWSRLTPRFQRESGGLTSYRGFWGPIATASALDVFAAPADHRITYRVRYTYPDGRTFVDNTRLELVLGDSGRYRIDGEG